MVLGIVALDRGTRSFGRCGIRSRLVLPLPLNADDGLESPCCIPPRLSDISECLAADLQVIHGFGRLGPRARTSVVDVGEASGEDEMNELNVCLTQCVLFAEDFENRDERLSRCDAVTAGGRCLRCLRRWG
jgi:hypothetical protein